MSVFSGLGNPSRDTLVIALTGALFLLTLAILLQTVVGSVAYAFGFTASVFEPFTVSLVVIVCAWTACVAGALASWSDVRQSAVVVAKRLGAMQASVRTGTEEEKALVKVVADVAIAYRCALPSIHVLPDETGINALVVGSLSGDKAILFTRGALRELSEDELSALAAHAFAHIANGDVPRNMKLMVAFSGLLALEQYGNLAVQRQYASKFYAPLSVVGYPLIGMGYVGVFFAGILHRLYTRAAVIRADVTATITLRQTRSMSRMLSSVLHSAEREIALHAAYTSEVRHVCFHAGRNRSWRSRIASSHPTIAARLQNIDPATAAAYTNGRIKTGRSPDRIDGAPAAGLGAGLGTGLGAGLGAGVRTGTARKATVASPEVSRAANEAAKALGIPQHRSRTAIVSDKLAMTVQDPLSSLATLFALFLPDDEEVQPGFLSAVAFAYNQNFADQVKHIKFVLQREMDVERLDVAQYAVDQLKGPLDTEASRRVLLNLERLLKVQGLYTLMNCAAVQFLRRELSADFTVLRRTADEREPDASARYLKPLDKMGEEMSRLVSLVLDATDLDRATVDSEYERVMSTYPNADYPRCDRDELADTAEMETVFQMLLMQPRNIRDTFILHCREMFSLNTDDVLPSRARLELLSASLLGAVGGVGAISVNGNVKINVNTTAGGAQKIA